MISGVLNAAFCDCEACMNETMVINLGERAIERNWPHSDFVMSRQILESDPLYYKVPDDAAPELVRFALTAGAMKARETISFYGMNEPLKIAQKMNVRIIFDITARTKKSFNALSCYKSSPPTIVVFENMLQVCREKLSESRKFPVNYLVKLTNIAVAHELYHHLERSDMDFINLACKVSVLDLKLFRVERSLSTLSEIAANSYAKHLMGLPFFPSIVAGSFFGDGYSEEEEVYDA